MFPEIVLTTKIFGTKMLVTILCSMQRNTEQIWLTLNVFHHNTFDEGAQCMNTIWSKSGKNL